MNKKFSTLVASLVLASCVGVASAQALDYSMFTKQGTEADALKANGAFQLSNVDGRVLAMVQTKDASGKVKLDLRMVANDGKTKLAETLWKVRWTASTDKVKKYYFTFESAAYGMPISFSTENAGKDALTAPENYEFPGKISTWEWEEGIAGEGIDYDQPLIYHFANPDSAMTLAVDKDGMVGAIKYAVSEGAFDALELTAMNVAEATLTAADLNSMMGTDTKKENFNLQFFKDVQNSSIGNLWTNSALKAVGIVKPSTSMFTGGTSGGYEFNLNQRTAAKLSKDAAISTEMPGVVAKAVAEASASSSGDAKTWADGVVAASGKAASFTESLDGVKASLLAQKNFVSQANSNLVAATEINKLVQAFPIEEVLGVNNTKELVDGVIATKIKTYEGSSLNGFAVTDMTNLFKAAVELNNTTAEFAASQKAVVTVAGKFAAIIIPDYTNDTKADVEKWIKDTKNVDADVAKVLLGQIHDIADAAGAVVAANKTFADLKTVADGVNDLVAKLPFIAYEKAWDIAKFKAEYTQIAVADPITQLVKDAILDKINKLPVTTTTPANAKLVVTDAMNDYQTASNAANLYTPVITAIDGAITDAKFIEKLKTAIEHSTKDLDKEGRDVSTAINAKMTGTTLPAAVKSVKALAEDYNNMIGEVIADKLDQTTADQYVSLKIGDDYLAVDTNVITGISGARHLQFAKLQYQDDLKNSDGEPLSIRMKRDYTGRFNFKFVYFPTQDSLVITTDGYGMKPHEGVENWVDMTDRQLKESYTYDANGKTVKLAVLTANHTEVTVGEPEAITGSEDKTLNTRIGFNIAFPEGVAIPAGVYTIKYVCNDKDNYKARNNGRNIVYNWLINDRQAMASVEDQNLNHMPAAQWVVTQDKGENLNSIVNRESGKPLEYNTNFGKVQHQYMFATSTPNLYTNIKKDSLMFTLVPEAFTTDSTLGYFAASKANKETDDQLKVYALSYLNDVEGLTVNAGNDSILKVGKYDKDTTAYFRLVPAFDATAYGASATGVAKELKRQAYYLQLETANKNIKDEDKLYISSSKDGKYKLTNAGYNFSNLDPFFMKEFKEVDGGHSYALIEAYRYMTGFFPEKLGYAKISVKDYPSILIQESLEGENQTEIYDNDTYGWIADGRTSTFVLTEKAAPKYRRLGVTNPGDSLNNLGINNVKINVTRESNRYLYENTKNAVAGYVGKATGVNYLGAEFTAKDASLFIDTAYVRNNTERPQYMLAVRVDSTTLKVPCHENPNHPFDEIKQVRGSYLVTLADSVAAYEGNKTMLDKFMYENRTYTRLAFVDAIHRNDSLLIQNSKYIGTMEAQKDKIYLGDNGIANNGAFQFRLTENNDKNAEFYIETAAGNSFVKLINGVAVLTNDISDAERFNIAKTTELPTANEDLNASAVTVIAGNGNVTILNAAGKTVVISNMLGQTIANTVLTSDNQTIAANGIIVVAVEGEEAVKAIIK